MHLIDHMDSTPPPYWSNTTPVVPYVSSHGWVTTPSVLVEPRGQGEALRWRLKYYTQEEDCGFGAGGMPNETD